MKKRILYILSTSLLVLCFALPAAALESTTTSGSNTSSSSSTSDSTTDTTDDTPKTNMTPPKSDADKAALAARLAKDKDETKVALTAADQAKLKTKCVAAQGVVKTLGGKVDASTTTRSQAYTELSKNLTALLVKLDAKGVDTATLKTEISTLTGKISTYKNDLTAYTQSLSDTNNVDCATDPTGFKASLEKSRTLRETLAKDVADIRTYVSGTIKPTLTAIRSQLDSTTTTTPTTGTTN